MPTAIKHIQRLACTALLLSLITLLIIGAARISALETTATQGKGTTSEEQPRYKAIWEPVNYKEDLQFTDVLFVNDKVGWVSGGGASFMKGGVILHTQDGGDNWRIQVGDPQSSELAYRELRFVDQKHGWAYQRNSNKLLRTTDGQTWEQIGTLPGDHTDYSFISPTVGVVSHRNEILRTEDAGRTWKEVFSCMMKAEVAGLTRNVQCRFHSLHFPSSNVGYAIGSSSQAPALYVAKTEDGGASWKVWSVLPGVKVREGDAFFTDANTGFVLLWGGNFLATTDGGQTWRGIAGGTAKANRKSSSPTARWDGQSPSMATSATLLMEQNGGFRASSRFRRTWRPSVFPSVTGVTSWVSML